MFTIVSMLATTPQDELTDEQVEIIRKMIRQQTANGQRHGILIIHVKDGAARWLSVGAVPIELPGPMKGTP